jgi:NAD-dependent DNA ligase
VSAEKLTKMEKVGSIIADSIMSGLRVPEMEKTIRSLIALGVGENAPVEEKNFGIFENKEALFYGEEKRLIKTLIKQAKIMIQKYDVTVTNPPYMGTSFMNGKLKKYVEKNYKNSKSIKYFITLLITIYII